MVDEFDVTLTDGDNGPTQQLMRFCSPMRAQKGCWGTFTSQVVVVVVAVAESAIHELEAGEAQLRALEMIKTHNKTLIVIIDSQVLYHGLIIGRSNALRKNRVAGITAGRKETAWIGWIPSKMKWAKDADIGT
jgi:hypothetical protein